VKEQAIVNSAAEVAKEMLESSEMGLPRIMHMET
jgi:hypothetical protein